MHHAAGPVAGAAPGLDGGAAAAAEPRPVARKATGVPAAAGLCRRLPHLPARIQGGCTGGQTAGGGAGCRVGLVATELATSVAGPLLTHPALQVLLSCSHTFHAACLASFERFSRHTAGATHRSCPLCRCASYEKWHIHDAAVLWRHTCATRIQAAWRGVLARRHARALRRLLPPTHPAVLRRWAVQELGECSKGLVASVDQGAAELDALFAELEATSRACQGVFAALEARCPGAGAAAAGAAGATDGGTGSRPATAQQGGSRGGPATGEQPRYAAAANLDCPAVPDWEAAIDRFLQREAPECPICLCCLAVSAPQDPSDRPATVAGRAAAAASAVCGPSSRRRDSNGPAASKGKNSRGAGGSSGPSATSGSGSGVAVLSCSHAFHSDCLSAFEAFALASDLPPACPCCRATYQRMDLR